MTKTGNTRRDSGKDGIASEITWFEANQHHLVAAVRRVRGRLEEHVGAASRREAHDVHSDVALETNEEHRGRPMALATVCSRFGLSLFERDLLVLCAGVELDAAVARLCATAHGEFDRRYASLGLAMAALDGAHWSAITPDAPLRRAHLLEVVSQGGTPITESPLRITERVLHFLTGIDETDRRLSAVMRRVTAPAELVPAHRSLSARLASIWGESPAASPVVQLSGDDHHTALAIAAGGAQQLGLRLFAIDAALVPERAAELDELARLFDREATLVSAALVVEAESVDGVPGTAAAARLLDRLSTPCAVSTRERWHSATRPVLRLDIEHPSADERRGAWRRCLNESGLRASEDTVEALVAEFQFGLGDIRAAVHQAIAAEGDASSLSALWDASRLRTRARLDGLAQRIDVSVGSNALVLPAGQHTMLREIAMQVRQRATVYERWGFGRNGARGLGVSALFAGPSGTGKTMAAEVLASELRLDLYRIDLSQVVDKYIGETEKRLRRIFDAAELGGTILLFDEADSLFGKRSEVKDSHDRYANIEVGYLLQRIESFRGLVVLTTNMRDALDDAFLRRIRFVVEFPFPGMEQRREIWRRAFPSDTPTEGLDVAKLARLHVAGGHIRNIAMNGAFLAADEAVPVRMHHLLQASRAEYVKLERSLTDAEVGGWT